MWKSLLELEIYGLDKFVPNTQVAPVLPVDDPLWSFQPAGSAADVEIQRLQDDAFIGAACGLEPAEVRKIVSSPTPTAAPAATTDTAERIERLVAKELCLSFDSMLKLGTIVVDDTLKKARWRSAITNIVEKVRNNPKLREIQDSEGWERLIAASVNCVEQCVRDCA